MKGLQIERLVRKPIQELKAYHVQPAVGLVKLDAMENPYSWPEHLKSALQEGLAAAAINRYPDPEAGRVKRQLRRVWSIADEYELLLGNGSDELIQILGMALAEPNAVCLSVSPTFVMYDMISRFVGMAFESVSLTSEFELDLNGFISAIEQHNPALIYLAQPNNPTGGAFKLADIEAIISAAPGVVVLDEAYVPFTDSNCLNLLALNPNVMVMRTVSKLGLAGLRLGVLVGHPAWINELNKIRLPYNINCFTQVAAEIALSHFDEFQRQTEQIRQDRASLMQQLSAIAELQCFPSEANFILVRVPAGRAGEIHQGMRDNGVLIKRLDGSHPLLANCLRITVGSAAENEACLSALSKVL